MELRDWIASALIRIVHCMEKDWPNTISVASGIEVELCKIAMIEPTNSEEFLRFLLLSSEQFPEKLFAAGLPSHLKERISELLAQRLELARTKGRLVATGKLEQAAHCYHLQMGVENEIHNALEGHKMVVTCDCVTDAIQRLGWIAKAS